MYHCGSGPRYCSHSAAFWSEQACAAVLAVQAAQAVTGGVRGSLEGQAGGAGAASKSVVSQASGGGGAATARASWRRRPGLPNVVISFTANETHTLGYIHKNTRQSKI
ncbi:hypothetical protein HF086_008201 [Spodoptera exigua]|uniref:Uncharacterized protein n=1 Tax=Spodoptera exigua TaxID=7107 RepID=A0A922M4Y0_SPOEX|nr:hypothetical protein HF086_008201 [Spodoptera exigua]